MAVPVNTSIVEHFQTLEDPRIERTKKHHLLDILVIALCTLLTGGEGSKIWNSLATASQPGFKPSSPCHTAFPRTIPSAGCLPVSILSVFRSALCPGPGQSRSSPKAPSSRWMGKPSKHPLIGPRPVLHYTCSQHGVPSRVASLLDKSSPRRNRMKLPLFQHYSDYLPSKGVS